MSDYVIETRALSKRYGRKLALNKLTLQIPRGRIHAIVGANGAGKSTLFRILLGFLAPTSGQSTILGCDSQSLTPALRSRIRGYGYEVYMKETFEDTPENRRKIAVFVAQEITKDKKIPHFSKAAVDFIIEEARKRANRKGHLTLRLPPTGQR